MPDVRWTSHRCRALIRSGDLTVSYLTYLIIGGVCMLAGAYGGILIGYALAGRLVRYALTRALALPSIQS